MKFSGDAETTAQEIQRQGGTALAVYGDVSKKEDAKRLVQSAVDHWGRIDIVVNNASSNWTGNILQMVEKTWDIQIASKLSGSFYLMHEALPYMAEQNFGRVLNSASDAFQGLTGYAAYGAGNAGVVALTKAAAKDLAGTGITVNAYTPLARTRSWYNAKTACRRKGISRDVVEANAPEAMRRTAEGMVPFLVWLASPEAGDITGRLFHLAADGEVGLWSDAQIIRSIRQPDGVWTLPELRERIPNELLRK